MLRISCAALRQEGQCRQGKGQPPNPRRGRASGTEAHQDRRQANDTGPQDQDRHRLSIGRMSHGFLLDQAGAGVKMGCPLPRLRRYFPQRGKISELKSSPSGGSGAPRRRGPCFLISSLRAQRSNLNPPQKRHLCRAIGPVVEGLIAVHGHRRLISGPFPDADGPGCEPAAG